MQLKPKTQVLPDIPQMIALSEAVGIPTLPIAPDGYIPWSVVRGVMFGPKTKIEEESRWQPKQVPGGHFYAPDPMVGRVRLMSYSEPSSDSYHIDLDIGDLNEIAEEQESEEFVEVMSESRESSVDEECGEEEKKGRPVIDWLNKRPKEIKYVKKIIPAKKPDQFNEDLKDRLHPLVREIVTRPWFPQSVSRTVGGVVSAFIGLMDLVNNEVHTEICAYIVRFKNELGFPDDELAVFINKLMTELDHPEPRKRANAVKTLEQLGVATNIVITAVIKQLIDAEPEVRKAAESCLAELKDIQNKDQLVSYLESIGAYKRNPTKLSEDELTEFLQKKTELSMSKFGEETGFDPMARVREWITRLTPSEAKKKKKGKKKRIVVKQDDTDNKHRGPVYKIKRRRMPKSFILKKKMVPNNAKMWKMFARKNAIDTNAKSKKANEQKVLENPENTVSEIEKQLEDGGKSVSPQKLADKLRELEEEEEDANQVDDWEVKNTKEMQAMQEQERVQVWPCAEGDIPENWHDFFSLPYVRARKKSQDFQKLAADQAEFLKKHNMIQQQTKGKSRKKDITNTIQSQQSRKFKQQKTEKAIQYSTAAAKALKRFYRGTYVTTKRSKHAHSNAVPSKNSQTSTTRHSSYTESSTSEKLAKLRDKSGGLTTIEENCPEYLDKEFQKPTYTLSNATEKSTKTADDSGIGVSIQETNTVTSDITSSTAKQINDNKTSVGQTTKNIDDSPKSQSPTDEPVPSPDLTSLALISRRRSTVFNLTPGLTTNIFSVPPSLPEVDEDSEDEDILMSPTNQDPDESQLHISPRSQSPTDEPVPSLDLTSLALRSRRRSTVFNLTPGLTTNIFSVPPSLPEVDEDSEDILMSPTNQDPDESQLHISPRSQSPTDEPVPSLDLTSLALRSRRRTTVCNLTPSLTTNIFSVPPSLPDTKDMKIEIANTESITTKPLAVRFTYNEVLDITHQPTSFMDESFCLPSIPETVEIAEGDMNAAQCRPRSAKVYRPSQIIRPFRELTSAIPIRQDAWCNMDREDLNGFLSSDWIPPSAPEPWPLRLSVVPDRCTKLTPLRASEFSSVQKERQETPSTPKITLGYLRKFEATSKCKVKRKQKLSKSVLLPPIRPSSPSTETPIETPNTEPNETTEYTEYLLSLPPCRNITKPIYCQSYWEPLTMPALSENKEKLIPTGKASFIWEKTFIEVT